MSNNSKYFREITGAFIEVVSRGAVVMLNFLYGQGTIKNVLFISSTCLMQLISSILFINTSIYGRGKITNNLKKAQGLLKNTNNKPQEDANTSLIKLTCAMTVLQLVCVIGNAFAPVLYKQGDLHFPLYMLISILAFSLGVIPGVIFRRVYKIQDEEISEDLCMQIQQGKRVC